MYAFGHHPKVASPLTDRSLKSTIGPYLYVATNTALQETYLNAKTL